MSAVIPPKQPKRVPPSLRLPIAAASTPPSLRLATTTTALLPPAVPRRAPLPLLALSVSAAALSLNSASSLSASSSSSDDNQQDSRGSEAGEQARRAGELLDAIRGPSTASSTGSSAIKTPPSAAASRRLRASASPSSSTATATTTEKVRLSADQDADDGRRGRLSLTLSISEGDAGRERGDREDGRDEGTLEDALRVQEEVEAEAMADVSPVTLVDLGKLGEGASGEVRKVRHTPSGRVMAKKTIPTSPNPALHKQHLRELAFMRECSDPHIVQYYGAFLEDNDTQIGICMEFCEGGSLDTIYKRIKLMNGRTGEKVLGKIAESILNGLVYLHNRKIIHRDIKPSNVLVTRRGEIKLCDFGVSGELINSFAGTFVGTTFYLAPERIRGGQYTINSDVWSMALTVLEVALNRFPFPADGEAPLNGPIELLTYLLKMDPPSLEDEPSLGIKYTGAFRSFVQLGLDKNPSTRPSPQRLLQHPWVQRSKVRQPPTDLSRWAALVWDWK